MFLLYFTYAYTLLKPCQDKHYYLQLLFSEDTLKFYSHYAIFNLNENDSQL